ncbi:hypothetical protein PIGHUM_01913 [Pigmentiphaga humi]|uniref:DUF883 domain-containing protein n=1 Tax=Pigmentiphaga humi TaxID=2478468 RepID=A0A3P4B2I1_9BURK|nr:DUF883 family protein [Pigmentiphaga humi]VCU69848.1 hypothetical protein PIGHUM_01913 [Pigmentiphaga humi]
MATYSDDWARSKDRIAGQVRGLLDEAETLLRSSAGHAGDELAVARERLHDQLARARTIYGDAQDRASQTYREASAQADAYVHDNPWRAIGIAAAVGVVIGLLATRR